MYASLVGRFLELERIRCLLDAATAGHAGTLLLHGGSGLGKSRLIRAAEDEAGRRGFQIVRARGHPVEAGVAFAVLSDAFVPLLVTQSPSRLSALARGAIGDLHRLFPMLGIAGASPPESSAQLYWTLAEVLRVLAVETPILIAVDDVQWADASSLEALHFLARQLSDSRVAMLWTLNDEAERSITLTTMRSTLAGLRIVDEMRLAPLTPADASSLIRRHLAGGPLSDEFVAALLERTRGNPLFIEALIGELQERGGTSVFEADVLTLKLPGTITGAVHSRMARHGPFARLVAECLSVIGTRTPLALVRLVVGAPGTAVDEALDELVAAQVLQANESGRELSYEFSHPLTRDTIYATLGAARRRTLHACVAAALEAAHPHGGESLAAEIAPHILRGEGALDPRGIDYLTIAGRDALSRFATAEAAAYLEEANEAATEAGIERPDILELLAHARQRQGDHPAAIALLTRLREHHAARGDGRAAARSTRRIALVLHLAGRLEEALAEYDAVLPAAAGRVDAALLAKVELERASILNRTGKVCEARTALHNALQAARSTDDAGTIARVHRDLLLFHSMSGPPALAREHGDEALRLSVETGNSALLSSCHWARAVLEGLTGNAAACAEHTMQALHHADAANSPVLRLAALEISIEQAFSTGEWDTGLATGTAAIAIARALNDRQVLPRLLVWTSLIHMGRGALAEAEALVTEAWICSRADIGLADVHAVVPAHIGRAALHLARLEFDAGIAVAEAALAIVDRTGYRAWAVHRLLPILAESYLHKHDFAAARRVEDRLRAEGTLLENPLALAWADTSAAILTWIEGDPERAAEIMRGCVDRLENVPFVPDAARLRRQLAGRLAQTGQRDEALRELRGAYAVFQRLDYRPELEKARGMFRELDARSPSPVISSRWLPLTGREQDIARRVADGRSNKAIARELGISVRTVSTHMSNIFRKLELNSRGELTNYVRMESGG